MFLRRAILLGDNSSFHETALLTVENLHLLLKMDLLLTTKCQQHTSTISLFVHPIILTIPNALLLPKAFWGDQ